MDDEVTAEDEDQQEKAGVLVWTGRVISTLVSLFLLMSGIMKLLAGGPEMEAQLREIGFTPSHLVPLGILEITCVVIYIIPRTSMIGAILLTGYMGGAICTHWRVGDWFVIQIVIALLVWLGLYLREKRLHNLIPLRR